MERCAYCGEPIRGSSIEFGDDVFCSEDCLDQFETGDDDDDYFGSDDYNDDDDGSVYRDY